MRLGDNHAFPELVRNYAGYGSASKITGGDGVARDMLKIPGAYNGKEGFFEFIREANGAINHRFFRPN
jgi:filamentous hemagglutinin